MHDITEVKTTANNRWLEILPSLTGINPESLDGNNRPCPKHCSPDHGGKDRFRMIDKAAGALLCNQCFSSKNGDGIAAVQWLLDCDFKTAVEKIGDYLGLQHRKKITSKTADPSAGLTFVDWNRSLANLWCLKKKPITEKALLKIGAKQATYKFRSEVFKVIAIPTTQHNIAKPVGWTLYNINGGTLPRQIGKSIKQVKVKLTFGSKSGVIGNIQPTATEVWKTEGPTDLLAFLSLDLPAGVSAFCNANGAKEDPVKSFSWLPATLKGKSIYTIHDCDEPGQQGATVIPQSDGSERTGWAPFLANAKESIVKNVVLPYEISATSGKDLRDWIGEGNDFEKLKSLASNAPQISAGQSTQIVNESVDDPHRLARINLENYWNVQKRKLIYWKETWLTWKNGCYCEITHDHLVARINESVKSEFNRQWVIENEKYDEWKNSKEYDSDKDKGPPFAKKVTTSIVRNVVEALKGMTVIQDRVKMHSWIKDGDNGTCVAAKNGIINISNFIENVESRMDEKRQTTNHEILTPPTPNWFSTSQLPFSYDSTAKCEKWQTFLDDVFKSDEESIDLLQKWFGYLLTPDNSKNKILFVIGEPRSGKGTIIRVLRSLLGEGNVATPTLTELGTQFGLENMVGKTSAILTDARISNRADESAITERLLSISGNDPQNVQRKFKSTLSGHELNIRFTLFSNLVPKLKDVSSAFLSRCLFLLMPNSYLGKENFNLQDELLEELPGVLNWAIAGKAKLNKSRTFHQPEAGMPLKNELRSIVSPVLSFIEDSCEFNEDYYVETHDIFDAWAQWCELNDVNHAGNIQSLSRKLRAIKPSLDVKQMRLGAARVRVMVGVKVKKEEAF